MSKREINIKDIGRVTIITSAKAKKMNIRLRPFEGIRITLPKGVDESYARNFLIEKKDWINKNMQRIREAENRHTVFTPETKFRTKYHRLVVRHKEQNGITLSIMEGKIIVNVPEKYRFEEELVQDAIRFSIEKALRLEADYYLRRRVDELSGQHGLPIQRLFLKNAKTRWGSCSGVNNINLSIHLMRLPDRLIDYVILHELAHTKHKNHSPGFWAFLDVLCEGRAKKLDRELNKFSIKIY